MSQPELASECEDAPCRRPEGCFTRVAVGSTPPMESRTRAPLGCKGPDLEILEGRRATHLAWAKRPPHHVKGRNRKRDGPPGSWVPHRWT